MKNLVIALAFVFLANASCQQAESKKKGTAENKDFVQKSFDRAEAQLKLAVADFQDLTKFPRSSNPDGSLHTRAANNWISGFFPGSLWYLYEYSEDNEFKQAAIKWTEALVEQQNNTKTHDIGFIMNCSYGNGLRLTGNEDYKPILIQSANSLMTRYNQNVGCTKSWDWATNWKFPVIIDNMMNMELLFEVSKLSGDSRYKDAAIHHATTTMQHHFRDDNSTYHVVDYNPVNGDVLEKVTHQGFSDSSAWVRGQAWGLYGYTVCYRETKDPEFLKQAEKIANFIINHPNTPDDLIPYWDYDAPGIPNEPRDASAAAIIASALLELSTYSDKKDVYFNRAEGILTSLSSDQYLAKEGTNNYFILKHCTGHKPADSEIDVPLVYGDYYFLEALLRYKKLKN